MARSTVSLAAALLLSAGAVAGAQQPQPAPRPMRDSMQRPMPRGMGRGMNDDMAAMHHMGPGGMQHPGMGPRGGVASMLLAQTATLKLTDQQVTRLAALARSAEAHQERMRTEMDSTHRAMMAGMRPGMPMPQMTPAMEARMKAAHDEMHANVRDALAVLTPDQLATAWEMRGAGPGRGPRPAMAPRPRAPKPE